jgi:hypothetical protein
MYVKPNRHTVPLSRNHCCRGKAISFAYSECVSVALLIQHAKRMHHIFICSLTVSYFVTLPYKRRDFRKKEYIGHEMCGVISTTAIVWSTSHSNKNSAKIFHKRVLVLMLFLSDCNYTWILWTSFKKILKYKISWKSVQWEPNRFMRTNWYTRSQESFSKIRERA